MSAPDPSLLELAGTLHHVPALNVMVIIIAILGIVLYYFGGKVPHVALYASCAAGLGVLFLVLATWLGAFRPCLAAAAFKASVLLPLALGGMMAAGVIWATAWVFSMKGSNPSPRVEALATAVLAVIALLAEKFGGMDRFRPSRLAASLTWWRYNKRFPDLNGQPTKVFKEAYEAINDDPISDDRGQIDGWGFSSTRRRLAKIQPAL